MFDLQMEYDQIITYQRLIEQFKNASLCLPLKTMENQSETEEIKGLQAEKKPSKTQVSKQIQHV